MESGLFSMTLPSLGKIDFGATPSRTNKGITLRCSTPETRITEQGIGGAVNEFYERVIIEVAMRDPKAEGEYLGREPQELISIEKYLVDLIKTNRGALHDEGVQYMDVVNVEMFPEIEGSEENQQIWYHLNITVILCYWMRITAPM
jgi:hypothetical protein